VSKVDAAGESHFQTVVVAEINKSSNSCSLMKSKVGFPSLIGRIHHDQVSSGFCCRGRQEQGRDGADSGIVGVA